MAKYQDIAEEIKQKIVHGGMHGVNHNHSLRIQAARNI